MYNMQLSNFAQKVNARYIFVSQVKVGLQTAVKNMVKKLNEVRKSVNNQ